MILDILVFRVVLEVLGDPGGLWDRLVLVVLAFPLVHQVRGDPVVFEVVGVEEVVQVDMDKDTSYPS